MDIGRRLNAGQTIPAGQTKVGHVSAIHSQRDGSTVDHISNPSANATVTKDTSGVDRQVQTQNNPDFRDICIYDDFIGIRRTSSEILQDHKALGRTVQKPYQEL